MPLRNCSYMFRYTFAAEERSPEHTMTYVWLLAVAFYGWSIGKEHAYVMKHCRGPDIFGIQRQILFTGYSQRFVCHACAVA